MRRRMFKLGLLGMLVVLAACEGEAALQNRIVSTQITGSADDGDSATPPASYNAGPGDAHDGDTHAQSDAAQFDRVGGMVDAQATDPTAPTLTEEEARSTSFNKVISTLVVTKKGTFTFDVAVSVTGIELVHDGTLLVSVRAALLDANGVTVPNGGIASHDADMGPNPQGGAPQIIINSDTNNPRSLDASGTYSPDPALAGPPNGIELDVGTYQLELDLRLRASAPIQVGEDGRKHRAKVDRATAVVTLR